jgi:hypothetical protein
MKVPILLLFSLIYSFVTGAQEINCKCKLVYGYNVVDKDVKRPENMGVERIFLNDSTVLESIIIKMGKKGDNDFHYSKVQHIDTFQLINSSLFKIVKGRKVKLFSRNDFKKKTVTIVRSTSDSNEVVYYYPDTIAFQNGRLVYRYRVDYEGFTDDAQKFRFIDFDPYYGIVRKGYGYFYYYEIANYVSTNKSYFIKESGDCETVKNWLSQNYYK